MESLVITYVGRSAIVLEANLNNFVCGIVGNTKSVNDVAYKSFVVKSISVKEPQYKHAKYFYINIKYWKKKRRNKKREKKISIE